VDHGAVDRSSVPGRALLLAIGGWVLAGGALYGLLQLVGRRLARGFYRSHEGDFAAAFLLLAYLLLFGALWLAFGGGAGLRARLGLRFTSAWHLAAAPGIWLVTVVVGAVVSVPFTRWLGPPQSNAAPLVHESRDPFAAVVLVAAVVVVAPVCEELLFRGAIFGWLRGRVPLVVAAPLSAAVFAGAHAFPPGLVLLFVFGLSAALVYQLTGSTLNSFVMHACQNLTAVLVAYTGIAGTTPR
jgi:membrane protease YdiL (CAAX protease family)